MPTLLLVDGSSYLYRAFHAMPDLRAVPIVRPVLEFPIVTIRLAKQPLSPAAMAFLAMARQHLKPSLV